MGRTNKLVDGCYSFWQGALFPLLQRLWPQYLLQAGIPAAIAERLDHAPSLPLLDIPPLPPLAAQQPAVQATTEVHRQKAHSQAGIHHRVSATGNRSVSGFSWVAPPDTVLEVAVNI